MTESASALPPHRGPGSAWRGLPARLAVVGVAAGVLLAGGDAAGWSAPILGAIPAGAGAGDLTLPAGCTFTAAGGKVDVKVPAGVGRLVAFVTGGEGGSPGATNGGGGGGGGETIADFSVTTEQVLTVWPGTRAGAAIVGRGYADGGSRGKGYGAKDGAAGGAASAVLTGSTPLVVAGGVERTAEHRLLHRLDHLLVQPGRRGSLPDAGPGPAEAPGMIIGTTWSSAGPMAAMASR